MGALRLAVAMLVIGCESRPLTLGADAGDARGGAGAQGVAGGGPGAAAGAAGGDRGGAGVTGGGGAVVETGCAYVTTKEEDCPGAETLALSTLGVSDYVGDGTVSAGDAAFVSLTLEAGEQGFGYPSIGLTSDNPLVTISPAVPEGTVYWVQPGGQIGATFDFLVDYAVADGTVVHFTACPGRLSTFCRGGRRLSFDVTVHPAVFPTWIPTSGRPAGSPPCSSTAPASDRVCGNLDTLSFSNPRAVVWRNGESLLVSPMAWLTNEGARAPTVCVRAASGGRTSSVAHAAVPAGKSAQVGTSPIEIDPTLPAGAKFHVTAWVDAIEADCNNGSRIEFDAVVP
jgi:hypothetical protein